MILANRLNKRLTFLKQTDETDEYNQRLDVWNPVFTVWGAIEDLQGDEFFAAKQENVEVETRIRIRYRNDIDRTMRIKCGDEEFEILYPIHPKRAKKELQLMCKERL